MSALAAAEPRPRAEAWNLRLVGHTDLDGQGDAMHVNLKDGYAFVGHMGFSRVGTSIVDVSDPTRPRLAGRLHAPAGTHTHKVQIVGDTLLVNHERNPWGRDNSAWSAGVAIYDVSRPTSPRQIAFFPTPGKGVHRLTYWEAPYAYLAGTDTGYLDQFLIILDLSEPARPREAGRWWFPGQHQAGGEMPSWTPTDHHQPGPRGERRYALHHALVRGDRAYCGWWDAGLVILDVADKARPALVSHLDFGASASTATHTALPVPGRDLVVVTDEETVEECQSPIRKQVRVVDVWDERRPRVISTFPVPEGDFCARGGRFGPHNLHEMRPGTLVDPTTMYVTYFTAGLRVVDISDPTRPREVAYYVPEPPPGRRASQVNDVLVAADGLMYVTDRYAGGLYILERARA